MQTGQAHGYEFKILTDPAGKKWPVIIFPELQTVIIPMISKHAAVDSQELMKYFTPLPPEEELKQIERVIEILENGLQAE